MVNIRDVAKLAGVAPITVSRVINNSDSVNPATRQRVQTAIDELHYVPNTLAKSLRSRHTQTIALILTDITNPFWTTIARGVEDAAAESGFHTILCNTDENPAKEATYINLLLQRRVDGIIIAPTTPDRKRLALLKQHQVACVLIDRRVAGFKADAVLGDNRQGACLLTEHLIELGHRRIALVNGPCSISTAQDRADGYRAALRQHQIPLEDGLIMEGGEFKQASGYQLVKQLLTHLPRPTAIFAANNLIAVGALQALREAALRVPEDIALVCFDDIGVASVVDPFFTVVAQPAYEMGEKSARLLIERLAAKRNLRPREIVFTPQLVIRQSCGSGLAKTA
jgi:LacI family transcriptional regulator